MTGQHAALSDQAAASRGPHPPSMPPPLQLSTAIAARPGSGWNSNLDAPLFAGEHRASTAYRSVLRSKRSI